MCLSVLVTYSSLQITVPNQYYVFMTTCFALNAFRLQYRDNTKDMELQFMCSDCPAVSSSLLSSGEKVVEIYHLTMLCSDCSDFRSQWLHSDARDSEILFTCVVYTL